MNKNDIKLIIIIIILFLAFFIFLNKDSDKQLVANVYYEDKIILTIDLTDDQYKEYSVDGANGKVLIVKENGNVKVLEENSPLHLCSNQGYISKSYESIVCLPNKIIIKIEGNSELDAVIR